MQVMQAKGYPVIMFVYFTYKYSVVVIGLYTFYF